MTKRRVGSSGAGLILLGVLLVVFAFSSTLSAATSTAKGKINTIDTGQKKLSLKLASGTIMLFNVPTGAHLSRNGSAVVLNKLTLRDSATVKYDPAKSNILSLTASGPRVSQSSGPVRGVKPATGTLKVSLKNFKATWASKLTRNGVVVPLGHLTKHDTVVVHSRPGTVQVNDVLGCGPEEVEMDGTILAVDPVAGTITVTPDNDTSDMTFTTDASTTIELDDAAVPLSGLSEGLAVEVEYDPETLLAYTICAETECDEDEIDGTVTAVDLTAGTITITPGGEEQGLQCYPETLTVTADTEIYVNGIAATLADVQVGMDAQVIYNDSTMVATKIVAGPGDGDDENECDISGTVTELGENLITITPTTEGLGCEEPVTLTVDGSTIITIDGQAALFTDIQLGDQAWAKYDENTLLAKEIKIGGGCETQKASLGYVAKKKGK